MPTLTQGQQRALNTLTTTALSVEMAELDAQNIETDDLSRSLPHGLQGLRRRLAALKLRAASRRHLNARAHVLRLEIPTGYNYFTQSGGFTWTTLLFQDFTVDSVLVLPGQPGTPATPDPADMDPRALAEVDTQNRWATLRHANAVLTLHGVSLAWTDHTYQGALLLDNTGRYLASVRIHPHSAADILTDDGSQTLVFTRYDMDAEAPVMACCAETVHSAQAGAFRPRTQTA
ncbi:hypothetical protein GLX28_20100 [Deinococcus xianganensis]|uniref:Uncharacterized protein n=2 Tax=Deinococcus xianganensis TaxID=1507289 RepID=A0A6I4YSH3_9DEIO|nr:hypothetical protein [Deinococcus xianganensis]